MKKIVVAALFAFVTVGLIFAYPRKEPSAAPKLVDTIKQVEQDWANATVNVDADKISNILADDWRGVGYAGKVSSKEIILSHLRSGKNKLESFQFGPMDVKVLGNVAVVQGSITEKRNDDGQANTFKAAWMDVFEKRGDQWLVVRSQSAKLQ